MSNKHTLLAMDLSIAQPGFAVLAIGTDGRPVILEKSVIKTNNKRSHGYRLITISEEIERLVNKYEPDIYVREKAFGRHAGSTMILNKVVGLSDYLLFKMREVEQIDEVAVGTIKKTVTGSGRGSKEDVALGVFRILGIEDTSDYYTKKGKLIDDLTDAIAVGLTYYSNEGLVDLK